MLTAPGSMGVLVAGVKFPWPSPARITRRLALRQAIARYRIAFDDNPEAFSEKWTVSEKILAKQIEHARAVLRDVRIPGTLFDLAVRFSTEANVQGHRSDVIILKTAKALAAMLEKKAVEKAHVAEAARYALLHRITADRMVTPEKLQETLEELLSQAMGEDAPADSAMDESSALDCWYEVSTQVPGHVAASSTDGIFSLLEEKKKRFSTPMNPSASRISI